MNDYTNNILKIMTTLNYVGKYYYTRFIEWIDVST